MGLCTGMLPAAALASATTTTQLLELAPKIVRISLRLGQESSRRSAQIEISHESWATIVPGVPLQDQRDILHRFHQVCVRAFHRPLIKLQKLKHIVGRTRKQKSLHQCRVQYDGNNQWATFHTSFSFLFLGYSQ